MRQARLDDRLGLDGRLDLVHLSGLEKLERLGRCEDGLHRDDLLRLDGRSGSSSPREGGGGHDGVDRRGRSLGRGLVLEPAGSTIGVGAVRTRRLARVIGEAAGCEPAATASGSAATSGSPATGWTATGPPAGHLDRRNAPQPCASADQIVCCDPVIARCTRASRRLSALASRAPSGTAEDRLVRRVRAGSAIGGSKGKTQALGSSRSVEQRVGRRL